MVTNKTIKNLNKIRRSTSMDYIQYLQAAGIDMANSEETKAISGMQYYKEKYPNINLKYIDLLMHMNHDLSRKNIINFTDNIEKLKKIDETSERDIILLSIIFNKLFIMEYLKVKNIISDKDYINLGTERATSFLLEARPLINKDIPDVENKPQYRSYQYANLRLTNFMKNMRIDSKNLYKINNLPTKQEEKEILENEFLKVNLLDVMLAKKSKQR